MPFLESLFYHAQLLDFLEAGACDVCYYYFSIARGQARWRLGFHHAQRPDFLRLGLFAKALYCCPVFLAYTHMACASSRKLASMYIYSDQVNVHDQLTQL